MTDTTKNLIHKSKEISKESCIFAKDFFARVFLTEDFLAKVF